MGEKEPARHTAGGARVVVRHLGMVPYGEALAYQRELVQRLAEDADYPEQLLAFFENRRSALTRKLAA